MKYIRISIVAVALLVVLGAVGWLFVKWSINRAFEPALNRNGAIHKVADKVEAALGATVARGDVVLRQAKTEKPVDGAALLNFQNKPPTQEGDVKLFQTWQSALAIVNMSFEINQLQQWK